MYLLPSASETNSALSYERVESLADVGGVGTAYLARALIPVLLREAELLEDQLEEALVFFGRPLC